jgi:hypothetical protein
VVSAVYRWAHAQEVAYELDLLVHRERLLGKVGEKAIVSTTPTRTAPLEILRDRLCRFLPEVLEEAGEVERRLAWCGLIAAPLTNGL